MSCQMLYMNIAEEVCKCSRWLHESIGAQ